MMLNIGGLDIDSNRCAAKTAYKLICNDEWVKNGTGHTTISRPTTKKVAIGCTSGLKTRNFQFGRCYKTKIFDREDCKSNRVFAHGDISFTNRSKTDKDTRNRFCGPKRKGDNVYSLREYNTMFSEGMAAIGISARNMVRENVGGRYIRICSDSQALVNEARDRLYELTMSNRITIT